MTQAQKKALLWLSRSWVFNCGSMARAVNSLCLYHPSLVEVQWGDFGYRGGRPFWRCSHEA